MLQRVRTPLSTAAAFQPTVSCGMSDALELPLRSRMQWVSTTEAYTQPARSDSNCSCCDCSSNTWLMRGPRPSHRAERSASYAIVRSGTRGPVVLIFVVIFVVIPLVIALVIPDHRRRRSTMRSHTARPLRPRIGDYE